MFSGFEEGTKHVNGVDISYVMSGSGSPVLLLHGFPQTKALWSRIAPVLAEKYTVVCADLRGYGDSSKPHPAPDADNYSFRQMALDNVELMAALGFDGFHVIGHDRGGRTGHRMALDHPGKVKSLAVLDIAPTYSMFEKVNRKVAHVYWHWYYLSQPAPFPESMIAADPDAFYETCLTGWGATGLDAFPPENLAEYRRCWRQPDAIAGSCADYRAAVLVDIEHDIADQDKKTTCPVLVLYGQDGVMAGSFNMEKEWAERCSTLKVATAPGGHFFVDQYPENVISELDRFLAMKTRQPGT